MILDSQRSTPQFSHGYVSYANNYVRCVPNRTFLELDFFQLSIINYCQSKYVSLSIGCQRLSFPTGMCPTSIIISGVPTEHFLELYFFQLSIINYCQSKYISLSIGCQRLSFPTGICVLLQ